MRHSSFTHIGNRWFDGTPDSIKSKSDICPSNLINELFLKIDSKLSTLYYCNFPLDKYREILKEKSNEIKIARKKNGIEYQCDVSGILIRTTDYLDGMKHGSEIIYQRNGQELQITEYLNDKKNGCKTSYYENGHICSQYTFKDDILDGPFEQYTNSGKCLAIGEYISGKPLTKIDPTDKDSRNYTLVSGSRRILVEKIGKIKILIGSLPLYNYHIEFVKMPTDEDKAIAKKFNILCLQ
jgi:hypothetical protein